jgi:hypothetical protein
MTTFGTTVVISMFKQAMIPLWWSNVNGWTQCNAGSLVLDSISKMKGLRPLYCQQELRAYE